MGQPPEKTKRSVLLSVNADGCDYTHTRTRSCIYEVVFMTQFTVSLVALGRLDNNLHIEVFVCSFSDCFTVGHF